MRQALISQHRFTDGKLKVRRYHQAKWDEPIIFELSTAGERGIALPELEADIIQNTMELPSLLPKSMLRDSLPALPEISQNQVLRHYLRLSQENLGADLNVDIGQGTCTMKYNPKVNEQIARQGKMLALHPRQAEETVQGIFNVYTRVEDVLKEISGMDCFSFQPRGGSSAILANAAIIRAYHQRNGNLAKKNEIITTMFSHPSDAACGKMCGFKVITLYPDERGYPSVAALQAAISERTAGLIITNPEDTGIFNPNIKTFVDMIHEVGGLAAYDQANANGLMGYTRAREAGFDLCHFNLHKTFSTPHACGGPAVGAMGVTNALKDLLPYPLIARDGDDFKTIDNSTTSIGKIGSWHGAASIVLRAYCWIAMLGAEGLKVASEIAVINNNYLMKRVLELAGVEVPYTGNQYRLEQVRYSWEKLYQETGITTAQIGLRMVDFGMHYWTSHHPYVVPQPMTLEPTESYSKKDLDEYVDTLAHVIKEAYHNPKKIIDAPHHAPIHQMDESGLDNPDQWIITWRSYLKQND